MQLANISIKNFRCIDKVEFSLKKYSSLIGPNNTGKSGVLRAIEIFLNQEKPSFEEWRRGHEEEPIIIEGEFNDIQDWERKSPGVAAHVFDSKIKIRMTASVEKDEKKNEKKILVIWESYCQEEEIEGWEPEATFTKLSKEIQDLAKKNNIGATEFKRANAQEALRSAIREAFPSKIKMSAAKWTGSKMSIPAALQQALPQAQLIPAVRDASEDGEAGVKGSSFGLLLERIILPAVMGSPEYGDLLSAVDALQKRLDGKDGTQIEAVKELSKDISERVSELIAAKVMLGMHAPDAKKFIGTSTHFKLDDGTPTRIEHQGHGLQRTLIFAMLEILASQSAKSVPTEKDQPINTRQTILLFEEPELFMHPHLIRRLKESLIKISQRKDWQVLVTTHSPFLIDVASDPLSLIIHRRENSSQAPALVQLKEDPFSLLKEKEERERLRAVLDFHPTVCEAFFAQYVVLVEGDTEIAALVRQPQLYKLAGLPDDCSRNVTVVACEGKWTIVPIARLMKAFGIPLRVIHDLDRKGKTDEELKTLPAHEFHANVKIAEVVGDSNAIYVSSDTFEDVLWEEGQAPKTRKDKPYRAWQRIRELCDDKHDLKHAPKLQEIVNFAFKEFSPEKPQAKAPSMASLALPIETAA